MLVGCLEFNVPFQHKYGYIRDEWFHVNNNITQTYKGSLHFTVICCTNKWIINERYIAEHQNKLNIYDLQNYEFFTNFFQPKNS